MWVEVQAKVTCWHADFGSDSNMAFALFFKFIYMIIMMLVISCVFSSFYYLIAICIIKRMIDILHKKKNEMNALQP